MRTPVNPRIAFRPSSNPQYTLHAQKNPKCSSPPQIRDEAVIISSMNLKGTKVVFNCQVKIDFVRQNLILKQFSTKEINQLKKVKMKKMKQLTSIKKV